MMKSQTIKNLVLNDLTEESQKSESEDNKSNNEIDFRHKEIDIKFELE